MNGLLRISVYLSLALSGFCASPVTSVPSAFVESQLRHSLEECFGTRLQIDYLEVLASKPDTSWFVAGRKVLLRRFGIRSLSATPDLYVWYGMSKDAASLIETSIEFRFRVKASWERVIASEALKAGELLSSQHIEIARLPWRPFEQPLSSAPVRILDYLGKYLTRSLRKGSVLAPGFLAEAPVVRAGELVSLVSTTEGLSIAVNAIAGQGGKVGDLIILKRVDNGIRMRGIVRGAGLVSAFSVFGASGQFAQEAKHDQF